MADAPPPPRVPGKPSSARPRWRLHRITVLVLVVGVIATAALAGAARTVHDRNEKRLVDQKVSEAGLIFQSALPGLSSTLLFAAITAEATNADAKTLGAILTPLIGTNQGQPFDSLSVWPADGEGEPVFELGGPTRPTDDDGRSLATFVRTTSKPTLRVRPLLQDETPALGYGVAAPFPGRKYVVYAENALPEDRTQRVRTGEAFQGMDYALYLDDDDDPESFLTASTDDLPFSGTTARDEIDLADRKLLIVMSAREELGGQLMAQLALYIALAGLASTLAFAFLAERLTRRRDHAEELAAENDRLYQDQRSVAETLQRSLLPDRLPELPDLEFRSRYEPGVRGIEIGGDWYDVVEVDDDRILLVVGDVSGRGLEAGSVMASIRYAIRAHATQGDRPGDILDKLGSVLQVGRDRHFATVLCIEVNRSDRSLRMANAGHPRPLVLRDGAASFLDPVVGPPVGVQASDQHYEETVATVEPGSTLLLYTDGLIERRGEPIDEGMERLRATATQVSSDGLGTFLDGVLDEMVGDERADDTALLGARWR